MGTTIITAVLVAGFLAASIACCAKADRLIHTGNSDTAIGLFATGIFGIFGGLIVGMPLIFGMF